MLPHNLGVVSNVSKLVVNCGFGFRALWFALRSGEGAHREADLTRDRALIYDDY